MNDTNIEIEGIPFDLNSILKQLKQDLKDDWFPDSLNHQDELDPDLITKRLAAFGKAPRKIFYGNEASLYNIPKQGFVLRYALETSVLDRLIYQGLADHLIKFSDRHLNTSVFSHRWSRKPGSKYLFMNLIESWKQFQDAVRGSLSSKTPWLLVTDIQNYFENIRISDVEESLNLLLSQSKLQPADNKISQQAIKLVGRMLKKWSPYKKHGIPQNRDASSFIANTLILHRHRGKWMKHLGYPC
jgi:hypothetical protein